ncbi:hypothetical protein [Blautia sp. MSJ-19]|uniref:hypothetical protein n=1 Tax=Blautia sp. MSJ-19 TaxID=2841517 RepID=UPI001C0EE9C1|nr:hypothetical protein [Blautia sp. MSJ-19]
MNNKVLLAFAVIGIMFTVLVIEEILSNLWTKIKLWRRDGCKIKCLCKPHIYEFDFCWPNSGELGLKCKKCGKRKKLYIDTESFKESHTGRVLWTRKK